jgi:hypothetical protein
VPTRRSFSRTPAAAAAGSRGRRPATTGRALGWEEKVGRAVPCGCALMYWFFVGNTLTCKLPKIKTSRGASVSRAWRVACARKRGSGFRRTGARRIPASHFSGGNLQREHKASCTTVCFYVRVTSEPASIDRICAYDPITGPILRPTTAKLRTK